MTKLTLTLAIAAAVATVAIAQLILWHTAAPAAGQDAAPTRTLEARIVALEAEVKRLDGEIAKTAAHFNTHAHDGRYSPAGHKHDAAAHDHPPEPFETITLSGPGGDPQHHVPHDLPAGRYRATFTTQTEYLITASIGASDGFGNYKSVLLRPNTPKTFTAQDGHRATHTGHPNDRIPSGPEIHVSQRSSTPWTITIERLGDLPADDN